MPEAINYIRDAKGNETHVIVPIDRWRDMTSELETAYLLRSPAMKRRLLEAMGRRDGISFEEDRERLGI